jgi:elongation factor Ts
VARSPEFKGLAREIAMHIAAASPEDVNSLLSQPFIKDPAKEVQSLLNEYIAKLGENIKIKQFARFQI